MLTNYNLLKRTMTNLNTGRGELNAGNGELNARRYLFLVYRLNALKKFKRVEKAFK